MTDTHTPAPGAGSDDGHEATPAVTGASGRTVSATAGVAVVTVRVGLVVAVGTVTAAGPS